MTRSWSIFSSTQPLAVPIPFQKEELNKWRFIIEEKKRDCDAMSAFAAAERRNLSEGQAAMGQQKVCLGLVPIPLDHL